MRRWLRIAPVLLALAFSYLLGCSKNPARLIIERGAPETELTYAPVEADTASFRVHLYWNGYDSDGEVVRFRFAIDSDTLKPALKWHVTYGHDSVFTFQVAPGNLVGGHVFWVSAEDNDGNIDHTPAKRYFSIRTVPPTARFTGGPEAGAFTASSVTFTWSGTDPDGGPTGDPAPVDSFETLLLRPGTSFDGNHTPLPAWAFAGATFYQNLLNQASGSALPAPYDDWKWTGTKHTSEALTGLTPGQWYVLAVRAVDAAGAHDAKMKFIQNVRHFLVAPSPEQQSPPQMVINSDVFSSAISTFYSYPPISVIPVNIRIPVLDGNPVTFSWTGYPGPAGYALAGFTSALDDTTGEAWDHPDLANTSITLPADLQPGGHMLFVRLLDVTGGSVIATFPLQIVHAAFRDPTQPHSILYVDDFAAPPGDWPAALRGSPNFPTDEAEDDWWTRVILAPLAREHGLTFEQWDAVYWGQFSTIGYREPPTLDDLAKHRVVIWSVDFNNSITSPTALWTLLHGHTGSALREYVRGGGTLILTGFALASDASMIGNVPSVHYSRGMCASLSPSSINSAWIGEYFLRDYMGLDGAMASNASSRRIGARDFVGATVTPEGAALGFQTAEVDTGVTGTSAKWDPYAFLSTSNVDGTLSPGLPMVEGWKLETALGCQADENSYRREDPALPIATPLFLYHGVNEGVLQDLGPSPREGLVCAIATQAHDNGKGGGGIVTPGNASGVTGRMVFLGFPAYYLKDAQAYQVMRTAFAYVNASPTLPAGVP